MLSSIRLCCSLLKPRMLTRLVPLATTPTLRSLSTTLVRHCDPPPIETDSDEKPSGLKPKTSLVNTPYEEIDAETSMRYVHSDAYQTTYGNDPVWTNYRRNFKGRFPPPVRKQCVRGGIYGTGNPCPICRDNYLVPYYRNVKLLKQFISPYSGQVLDNMQTGVCTKQHRKIMVAVEQAWDYGLIDMPFEKRQYDYRDYYGDLMPKEEKTTDASSSST